MPDSNVRWLEVQHAPLPSFDVPIEIYTEAKQPQCRGETTTCCQTATSNIAPKVLRGNRKNNKDLFCPAVA